MGTTVPSVCPRRAELVNSWVLSVRAPIVGFQAEGPGPGPVLLDAAFGPSCHTDTDGSRLDHSDNHPLSLFTLWLFFSILFKDLGDPLPRDPQHAL